MGDDALVAEFARASDAVCAARSFQQSHIEHLLTLSDEIKPTVRIGVSLGEVVFADNTVTGVGVVMAQRALRWTRRAAKAVIRSVVVLLACAAIPEQLDADPTQASSADKSSVTATGTGNCGFPELVMEPALDFLVGRNGDRGGGVMRIFSLDYGLLWSGSSGLSDHLSGREMGTSNNFQIASITKTFTATVVLQLVEESAFKLDDRLGDLLPETVTRKLLVIDGHDYGPELTVRQLLSHTSGLPDYWSDPPFVEDENNAFMLEFIAGIRDHMWKPQEILTYVRMLDPIDTPGASYHYADSGYVVLGMLIEKFEGKALHEVYRERIFDPLGMDATYMNYHEPARSNRVVSHRYEHGQDDYGLVGYSADWAGGGLVSNAEELELFIVALADDQLFLERETGELMRSWVETGETGTGYGLGLFHVELRYGRGDMWGHGGYGETWMYYWPKYRVTFTGTLNEENNDWWYLAGRAMDQIEAGH